MRTLSRVFSVCCLIVSVGCMSYRFISWVIMLLCNVLGASNQERPEGSWPITGDLPYLSWVCGHLFGAVMLESFIGDLVHCLLSNERLEGSNWPRCLMSRSRSDPFILAIWLCAAFRNCINLFWNKFIKHVLQESGAGTQHSVCWMLNPPHVLNPDLKLNMLYAGYPFAR